MGVVKSNLSYNGQVIEQRVSDNYVNLTQMAKANNVEIKDFNRSEFAQKYLKALQESEGADFTPTVNSSIGFPAIKTTWGHPLVAIAFGQWISPEFHVWCNMNIQTLMTHGAVSLPQAELPKLPSRQMAVETASSIKFIKDILEDTDPRLAQFLIDYAISDIISTQNLLTGDRLRGVVEIATDLGYSVDSKNRGQLGKFVKANCGELAQQEERLVNGTLRKVGVFPDNEIVRNVITKFFS